MIGQGLVSDPFLAGRIKHHARSNKDQLSSFLDDLLIGYTEQFGSSNNAAKKMKDLWFYLIRLFKDSENYGKKILKSKNADEYLFAVRTVFDTLELAEESSGGW